MKVTPTPQNNLQLAFDIRRGQWLVSDAAALLPVALDLLTHVQPTLFDTLEFLPMAYLSSGGAVPLDSTTEPPKENCVATIPLCGTITKYDTCGTIGTSTIASELIRMATKKQVVGIVLDIDSGGGACNAIPQMIEAIHKVQSMGKPIVAHCDLCASAAYWIASQCDAIYADNLLSRIGSIGVMTQIIDDSNSANGDKVISVYATESPDKNLPYRKALGGDFSLLQSEMSPIVKQFHAAIKSGRINLQSDAPGVLTGAIFMSEQAKDVGLVDDIRTLAESVENVFVRSEYNNS